MPWFSLLDQNASELNQDDLYLICEKFLSSKIIRQLIISGFPSDAKSIQQIMRVDAEKMQFLGFILSTFTLGFGFYYKTSIWSTCNILLFAATQGSATCLLSYILLCLYLRYIQPNKRVFGMVLVGYISGSLRGIRFSNCPACKNWEKIWSVIWCWKDWNDSCNILKHEQFQRIHNCRTCNQK